MRADTSGLAARLTALLEEEPAARNVQAAYLFGSRARGDHGAGSDVDLAVLLTEPVAPGLAGGGLDLETALERALRLPVQVVVLNRAPVDLVQRVLRDGVILADRDPVARVRFEVKARFDYWDLRPVLQRYRRLPETMP